MKMLLKTLASLTLMLSVGVNAQQAQQFGDYTVHYLSLIHI